MTPEALKNAVYEAKRFLERASKAKTCTWVDQSQKNHSELDPGEHAASLRRVSMDLTKALANLRKP
jgi:hypothetical protein